MAVNRFHAFADGLTFASPERLGHLPAGDPQYVRAQELWSRFRQVAKISNEALLGPDAWAINLLGDSSRLTVGSSTVVRGVIRVERRGHVRIGDYCYIGDDVILSAHAGIDIGQDVLLAHGVQVFDNITHPIDAAERAKHYRAILSGVSYEPSIPAAPVVIESNVWIGMNSIIMRGVRIGARSIVAAGSVVIDDVPADVIVRGNPAHVMRDSQTDSRI
jgi:acetyltransferase-like isoleucine patch superfamily enzyme